MFDDAVLHLSPCGRGRRYRGGRGVPRATRGIKIGALLLYSSALRWSYSARSAEYPSPATLRVTPPQPSSSSEEGAMATAWNDSTSPTRGEVKRRSPRKRRTIPTLLKELPLVFNILPLIRIRRWCAFFSDIGPYFGVVGVDFDKGFLVFR